MEEGTARSPEFDQVLPENAFKILRIQVRLESHSVRQDNSQYRGSRQIGVARLGNVLNPPIENISTFQLPVDGLGLFMLDSDQQLPVPVGSNIVCAAGATNCP